MKSVILNSPLAKIPPKKFLNFAIKKSLKRLRGPSEEKKRIKELFDEGGSWGKGLILDVEGINAYHFSCNGSTEFYWLKDAPLVPFPKRIKDKNVEELIRIQKTGNYANCEVILPYKVFLRMLGEEISPYNAKKKGELKLIDYDGWGSMYHATVLMKFFENLRSSVGL